MGKRIERREQPSAFPSRRRFLATVGALTGSGLLAGCDSRSNGNDTPTADAGTDDGTGTDTTDDTPTDEPRRTYFEAGPRVGIEEVATGLVSPNALVTADDGTDRRFVVDQVGKVYVHDSDGLQDEPFLDVSGNLVALGEDLPDWIPYDERGLLGLAFHPEFESNGLLYVRYSTPTDETDIDHVERLSEFTATEGGSRVDHDSERILFDLDWHRPLHQGGTIEFGPDGYLYASLGDGLNPANGQDVTNNLMGSVLRLDVDSRTDDLPYGIPPDNPLVGKEGRDEHYAWGLRNPWKMAFSGDQLILGDVGQATWEEINVIEKGRNYGWPLMEGRHCHDPETGQSEEGPCDVTSERGETLVDPVLEFPHFDEEGYPVGFAVIGGHVHTGDVAAIQDSYVFGIYTSSFERPAGRLLAATPRSSGSWPTKELLVEGGLDIQVLSLGKDDGDTYVMGTRAALSADPLSKESGVVYRITS